MKTVHIFLSVDMRMGHDGLSSYAKKKGVELALLPSQTACVFIARDRRRIKAYSANGVLCYVKALTNRPFDLEALDYIPQAFSPDGVMDYDKALRKRLEKIFSKRGALKEEHLAPVKQHVLRKAIQTQMRV